MDESQFNVHFNSILVMSGQWGDVNALCSRTAIQLEKYRPQAGLKLETTRSVG